MNKKEHYNILVPNGAGKENLIQKLQQAELILEGADSSKIKLYSVLLLNQFIKEEELHDKFIVSNAREQSLKSMSSGERKRALLDHLLQENIDILILDNPLDSLDVAGREMLTKRIRESAVHCTIINVVSRERDFLPFATLTYQYSDSEFVEFKHQDESSAVLLRGNIPASITERTYDGQVLIDMNDVNVSYYDRPILKDISWQIKRGEFWQLKGPNGAGKTTMLSMITGDNHKAYGQDIILFGHKKGSGESVWDIKKNIGYYTSTMTYDFWRNQSVEHMIISGYHDSVGLYQHPTELQRKRAEAWMDLIGLTGQKDKPFIKLPMGHKRLVLIARAMVKHPPLLILDEPTSDLDDYNVRLMITLINKIAQESETAILYVSHQDEAGLKPDRVYELVPSEQGSIGKEI